MALFTSRFTPRGRGAAYALAPALVALTTWLLAAVQAALTRQAGGHYVRPFGIAYVAPIAALAVLGGARAGLLTLALSLLAMGYLLAPYGLASPFRNALNLSELGFVCLVGGLAVGGGEAVRRNAELLRERQGAAEREKEAAERQRRLLREVLASVTDGRLRLCEDASELPPCLTPLGDPVPLSKDDVRGLRRAVGEAVRGRGFPEERCLDLMTAASEAAMNAVVHGGGGEGRVCLRPDDTVQVWVEDQGGGIALDQLPRATLERGHSTAGTLGHGFWLMLQTADRLWLVTGERGTTVVLEQERTPPAPLWQ